MMIDGVDAKDIVERSIRDGLVDRPVQLQATLDSDEKRELSDTIMAARRRMAERQKHEDRTDRVRGIGQPGSNNIIDGRQAFAVVAQSIQQGMVQARCRQQQAPTLFEVLFQRPVREIKQLAWTKESTRKWRARNRALAQILTVIEGQQ